MILTIAAGGCKSLSTVMSGRRRLLSVQAGHLTETADGYGGVMITSGWVTSRGDGRPTIMADGAL